jgi:peptidyl-prolyl cis-trans isomerase SurA
MSDAEQRALARNVLREKKLDEAYLAWSEDVRGRAYVEMREPAQ